MSASLGVVIPAYRPDTDLLRQYVRALDERLQPSTIRIELDAPTDGVSEQLSDLPATINTVPRRRGKGNAITAGFEALGTDVFAFADADGATPAAEMAGIIKEITDGDADLAAGSRRHPDAEVATHQTVARRRLGDTFAWLARQTLSVELYDYQCGAKALTAEGWNQVRTHLYESGFAWDIELISMADALGLHVVEVPVEWHDRPGSTVSTVQTPLQLARALLIARYRANRLRDQRLHTQPGWHEESTAVIEQE